MGVRLRHLARMTAIFNPFSGDMVCVYMLDGTGRKGWCCAHESLEAVVACKLVLEGFFCWEVNGGPSEASGKDDSNL